MGVALSRPGNAPAQDDALAPAPWDPAMMQVAIQAMVVEVNRDSTRDIGVDYTYNRDETRHPGSALEATDVRFPISLDPVLVPVFEDVGTLGDFAIGQVSRAPGIGASLVGMNVGDAGRVWANLRALLEQGEAEIRTLPIVVALNNTKAEVTTADEIPYQDVEFVGGEARLSVKFEKVGVKLTITPRIVEPLAKELVELNIEQLEVSGVSTFVTIRNVNRPVFVTSNVNTRVWLHNAESLVIGGLKSKREVVVESRLPFLGKIFVLGRMFKKEHREIKDTDIYFYITPYIVPPGVNTILPMDFAHGEVLAPPSQGDKQ
jgi:type II secretory pathway component GspD/PulD (secretin)